MSCPASSRHARANSVMPAQAGIQRWIGWPTIYGGFLLYAVAQEVCPPERGRSKPLLKILNEMKGGFDIFVRTSFTSFRILRQGS